MPVGGRRAAPVQVDIASVPLAARRLTIKGECLVLIRNAQNAGLQWSESEKTITKFPVDIPNEMTAAAGH